MSTEPPEAKYRLTLTIDGSSHEEIERELLSMTRGGYILDSDGYERDTFHVVGGRRTSILEHTNPEMTPDRYDAELDAWWQERRAEHKSPTRSAPTTAAGENVWPTAKQLADGLAVCTEAERITHADIAIRDAQAHHRCLVAHTSEALRAEITERTRWTDWLATIGYGINFGAIGGTEPPCTLGELAVAYERVTGEEDAETWAWCITQETGALTTTEEPL